MAAVLPMRRIEKDNRGRTYSFRKSGGGIEIRAFANGMTDGGTTFRVYYNGKEKTIRDMDFPEKLSKKQELAVAQALDHVYRHGRINGSDDS